MRNVAAALLLVLGSTVVAFAVPTAGVPEIDPGSIVTASALLGSALLMMKRRAKR
jgi:hypothetical protein